MNRPDPPFKFLLCDVGRWIICPAFQSPKEQFKIYHKVKPSKDAVLSIVPLGYELDESGLTFTLPPNSWGPVRVR